MGIKIGMVGCGRFAPGFIRFFRDHKHQRETMLEMVPVEQMRTPLPPDVLAALGGWQT